MRHILTGFGFVACLLFIAAAVVQADTEAGETIDWFVIGSGGGTMSSSNYTVSGTVGQVAAGPVSSANYTINQGYWQSLESSGGDCTMRGDMNCDGTINISDMTYLVSFLFSGGPTPCFAAHGDINCDTSINISDMTYLVSFLFSGGPAPCPC